MNSQTIPFIQKHNPKSISTIEEIIEDMRQGKMVILIDDEDRENEGDLIMAAESITAEAINFMATHARGLVCLTLSEQRCKQLDLPLMVRDNRASLATNFTVSIEASTGVTTGISTADRARTVQAAISKNAVPEDIVKPGHIFPLMAQPGGVLTRAGHTEAGCDLAQMAGYEPASVICEIMNDDGTMARLPELLVFAEQHQIKVGTIADLINYRHRTEKLVRCVNRKKLTTIYGEFEVANYIDDTTGNRHLALICGEPNSNNPTLVRVHAPANDFDLLDNDRNNHSWSVAEALSYIQTKGEGVLLLLKGNNDDMGNQNQYTWKESDYYLKHYGVGAQILKDLGVRNMTLMTWPRKIPSMNGFGLTVNNYLLPDEKLVEFA
jgi:3,4-dihydroxy 2-butanone 4-phosphate synthase/GTP cyclohydrolase II